uniref:Uncharacterized protein n=1 Tax=Arundo donax TaxID=35708 RepID=A0A0A9AHQ9_ARUDO
MINLSEREMILIVTNQRTNRLNMTNNVKT